MLPYLPQEVLELILWKLPIKSRFQFLTVSKEWKELITPRLHTPSDSTIFLLGSSSSSNEFSFNLDNEGIFEEYATCSLEEEEEEEDDEDRQLNVSGCGYGLIVFTMGEIVMVFNPHVRRFLFLPESGLDGYTKAFLVVVDHSKNECKIVKTNDESRVEIFRQSSGQWEFVVNDFPLFPVLGCQVDLKGKSYWIAEDDDENMFLVSFDGRTELFSRVLTKLPCISANWFPFFHNYGNQFLFLFDESLIYVHSEAEAEDEDEDDTDGTEKCAMLCNIWKMVDARGEAWERYRTLCFKEPMIPLGGRGDGEFLWAGVYTKKLISTNFQNGSFTKLGNHSAGRLLSCPNYVETTALLNA